MLRPLGLAILLPVVLGVACGGGGDEDDAEQSPSPTGIRTLTDATDPTNDSGASPDESPLLRLLGSIPDTPESASFITYVNLVEFYEAFETAAPPREASDDEFVEWVVSAIEPSTEINGPPVAAAISFIMRAFLDARAYREEIGLDPATIEQAVEAGEPPETYLVLRGTFDAVSIEAAVHDDPTFSGLLDEGSHGGVDYYTWDDDFKVDFTRTTPVRYLGRGGRLGLYQDLFLWSYWTEGMTGMIDAVSDESDSLAEREDLRQVAEKLEGLGAYSVQMIGSFPPEAGQGSVLTAYTSVGLGGGIEADHPFLALVITHEDATAAANNVDAFEKWVTESTDEFGSAWSERIDSIEATVEDTTAIVLLRGLDLPWDLFHHHPQLLVGE